VGDQILQERLESTPDDAIYNRADHIQTVRESSLPTDTQSLRNSNVKSKPISKNIDNNSAKLMQ